MPGKTEKDVKKLLTSLFDEDSAMAVGELADGGNSGAECAWGTVDGCPVYAFATDGGGFGASAAAKVAKLCSMAAKTGAPVVGFYDNLGVKLGDGAQVMSALGQLMNCVNSLSGVVPQISVVCGTCGGSMAMIASCADLLVMTEDSEFFLTAPDIIKAANPGCKTGVGDAKTAAENGSAAIVAENAEAAVAAVRRLLGYLPANNLDQAPGFEPCAAENGEVFDAGSFCELYADYGKSVKVGFAAVEGQVVGAVVTAADEKGKIGFCAAAKAARFVRICDAYSIPVVSVIDAAGFCSCADAEHNGSVGIAARLSHAYAEATTAKVAVIKGKAIGPLYIAMAGKGANADMVFAMESSVISPLGVEASVLINKPEELAKCENDGDRARLFADYAANEACAKAAACAGLVDSVVTDSELRDRLTRALDMLAGKRESRLPKKHSII